MHRIGFFGEKQPLTEAQRRALREVLVGFKSEALVEGIDYPDFHHGGAAGAEVEAHEIALSLGFRTIIHPSKRPELNAEIHGHEKRPVAYGAFSLHFILHEVDQVIVAPFIPLICPSKTWGAVTICNNGQKNLENLQKEYAKRGVLSREQAMRVQQTGKPFHSFEEALEDRMARKPMSPPALLKNKPVLVVYPNGEVETSTFSGPRLTD